MRTLQTELKKLNLLKSTSSSRQAKRGQPRDTKHWQSDHDWSKVEAELLKSQAGQEAS